MILLLAGLPVRQLQCQPHSPGGRLGQNTPALLPREVCVPARSLATPKADLAAVPLQEMGAAVVSQVNLQGSSTAPLQPQ